MIYHVAKKGSNKNKGTEEAPLLTIQAAADVAMPGDRIIVHEGVYREWVRPIRGGESDSRRIIYEAAAGERPIIKGSEVVKEWKRFNHKIWYTEVPNHIFGSYNPFAMAVWGDWLVAPKGYEVHLGDVYINGNSLYEAESIEALENPVRREYSLNETWGWRKEALLHPERSIYQWCAKVDEENTVIYANFGETDPNEALTEINVRPCCFYPEHTEINYITVRGFEMAQAATPWAPPTADQIGMIGPHWSKGWIIEENIFHDAKCSAVSLGKDGSTGNNEFSIYRKKAGYHKQMEAVFKAFHSGWRKERVGSHIVRNNQIYECGQNGIVGHMGCIFSEIYGNEIYAIAKKHEFWGHEIAGIKLHAAIDVQIYENHIHHCSLGSWLDWQAQGARVSRNVYDHNNRDFMIEVTHGPYLVDNNIFASEYSMDNYAQGGAYINNFCGGFLNRVSVPERATPYHFPHTTEILGTTPVYSGDDRWFQNIFIGGEEEGKKYGTADYDGSTTSIEEYVKAYWENGDEDLQTYEAIKQPAYIDGNVYFSSAKAFEREKHHVIVDTKINWNVEDREDGCYLEIDIPEEIFTLSGRVIGTDDLEPTRLSEAFYENPDGSKLLVAWDLLGEKFGENILAGPIQSLKPGKNDILIWKKRAHR